MLVIKKQKREKGNVTVTIRINQKSLIDLKKSGYSLSEVCQDAVNKKILSEKTKARKK